jgi:RNA polymerase sigma-70 factor (TIGR02957 family)
MQMNEATSIFSNLRPKLQGLAYRMLGSVSDSEDIVQETWISWNNADHASISNSEGWLMATAMRRAIDQLRVAKARREEYVGIWLPEPILTGDETSPADLAELADDVSVAFLLLLERLTPESRAAFLLHEVFDTDYDEIATIVGKTAASCRQLVHRAKDRLRQDRPVLKKSGDENLEMMRKLANALSAADFPAIRSLLAVDADLSGDGGGKVVTIPKPMLGGQRVAQVLYAAHLRYGADIEIRLARINSEWAILRYIEGQLESAQTYVINDKTITSIHVQRNPDKLARIAKGFHGFSGRA